MSIAIGICRTYLSALLRRHARFHYSGDYRIGTRYLDEPILDPLKQQAMQVAFLRDLLRRDWISVRNTIKVCCWRQCASRRFDGRPWLGCI